MNRLLSAALLSSVLAQAPLAHAAESQECGPAVLATLGRALKVAHFAPGPDSDGKDPAGVVLVSSCKRMPDDPRLTLAAVGWDAHEKDAKSLVVAIVDEAASTVVALHQDEILEDATTQVHEGVLRLDTAPYDLAPGVRAFGVDFVNDNPGCGEGGIGPSRTLYVREGKTLRPVLQDLQISGYTYLRGNQARCVSDPHDSETAILEDDAVAIGLGAPGKGGWRDLVLTVTARRSDHKPSRKPLHVRVPYDGSTYDLTAFNKADAEWGK